MAVINIDLGAIVPGAYVKIVDPAHMAWGTKKKLLKQMGDKVSADGKVNASALDMIEAVEKIIPDLVQEWNLTGGDGAVLPLPSQDPSVLDRTDTAVVEELIRQIGDRMQGFTKPAAASAPAQNPNG